jgi:hypothetical protein
MQTFFEFIGKFAVFGVIPATGDGAKKSRRLFGGLRLWLFRLVNRLIATSNSPAY